MDSKYGRLWTDDDVKRLVELYGTGCGDDIDTIMAETKGTFPTDEPLFLLRGQDLAAPDAIATGIGGDDSTVIVGDYLASATRRGASGEFLQHVTAAALEMKRWQLEHPDRVHTPD